MRAFTGSFPYTFAINFSATSSPLKTAQESASKINHPKLVLTSGATEYTYYGPDTVLRFEHSETDDSHVTDLLLNNADGTFTSLDLKGFTANLFHGLDTSIGYQYSCTAPKVVADKKCISYRGKLLCRLLLTGYPDYLRKQKAKLRYEHNATSTKTVEDLITEVMDGDPVSESLYEQQLTSNANNTADAAANCAGGGQRLIIDGRTITAIAFKLKKVGSPTGNVTFHLYDPVTDTELATVVWGNASTLTTSSTWCEGTLATPVTTDAEHDLVLFWDHATGDSTNYVSGAYNNFDVKSGEYYVNILATGTNYFEYISDQDCACKYKYTYAGISVFEDEPSYEVVYDSKDSLIDSYCPAESFIIEESENRKAVVDGLLWHTGCQSRWENDGKLHVFVPTISGTTYDAEYALSGHVFFDKSVKDGLVSPNEYVVRSLLTQSTSYTGTATSAASYALHKVTEYIRIAATGNAQCAAMAAALISHQELAAQQGGATVPVNVAQELYDYIKITDARAGDTKAGNIGALTVYYDSGYFGNARYDMYFQFGKPAIKSVPGAVSDSVRSIRLNRPPDDPYMKWNDVGEWMDEVEIGLEKLLLWSGIKKAETPAQTLIAESLVGIQTQAGAQKFGLPEGYTELLLTSVTSDTGWVDLDLSSYVPVGTVAAIIQIYIKPQVIGNDDNLSVRLRKKGLSDVIPEFEVGDYAEAGEDHFSQVIVGVNTDRLIQYNLNITNTSLSAEFVVTLELQGYWKTG